MLPVGGNQSTPDIAAAPNSVATLYSKRGLTSPMGDSGTRDTALPYSRSLMGSQEWPPRSKKVRGGTRDEEPLTQNAGST